MKVHQAIARALADNGVERMFGLAGDANLYLIDSFVCDCGGKYVACVHEAGVATMALGHAALSGGVGVGTVTHGPAMINTLTALVDGVKARTPIVLVCGDTGVEDRFGAQNVAQRAFAEAAGAGFEQLRAPATVAEDVATALRRAMVERRPVVLNVPIDLQWLDTDYRPVRHYVPSGRVAAPDGDDIDNAAGIIAAARRPLILAGRGAIAPEAKAALLRLAARIEAPLATTLKAKGLFRGHDFDLGIFGTLGQPHGVDIILESDCVIAFGAGLNRFTTSNDAFLQGKRVVQVDLDRTQLGRMARIDAGVVGDSALVAQRFVELLDEAEIPPSGFADAAMKARIAAAPPPPATTGGDGEGFIDIRRAMAAFNAAVPQDRVLVTDGGRFVAEAWKTFDVQDPKDFLSTINCGSIGLGVSYGIGASFAAGGRPVLVVCGDGGFMHGGLAEFTTAVRTGADLIVLLFNDGSYGAEYMQFQAKGMEPGLSLFDWPDFEPLAQAMGAAAATVRSEADLGPAIAVIAGRKGPVLIDIRLDPARVPFL